VTFRIESSEKIEQLVCCEAAEMSVQQVRYVGLGNSQNASDFALFQLFPLQHFEDMESYLRASHELIRVSQAEVREDILAEWALVPLSACSRRFSRLALKKGTVSLDN